MGALVKMKSRDPNASSDIFSTRRDFLKTASAASAALAGGLGTTRAFSSDAEASASSVEQCSFSALPPDFVYLNSGTEGSMPECVLATLRDGLNKWASDPTTSYETDPVLGKHQELNREKIAAFLGVGMNNICLTDNTTMGLSMTLMGLNFRPGDKVVTTNHERYNQSRTQCHKISVASPAGKNWAAGRNTNLPRLSSTQRNGLQ